MNSNIFKKDNSGRSVAFFLRKNCIIKKKHTNDLIKLSKKTKKDSRICFHKNKNSKLHVMLNCIVKKNQYFPEIHKNVDEFYNILEGRLKLLIVNRSNKILKKIILTKNNYFFLNKKNIHYTIPLTDYCLIIESRIGPLRKKDTIRFKNISKR